jgi:hypothetical protein
MIAKSLDGFIAKPKDDLIPDLFNFITNAQTNNYLANQWKILKNI